MIKRWRGWGIRLLLLAGAPLHAQSYFCQTPSGQPTAEAKNLVCLLPNLGFPPAASQPIAGLDAAIASQASLFPLASPASGVIYTNDPALQIPVPSGTDSFGPVMFERGETLHRGKLFVSVTYQHFEFDKMDGINLKNFSAVFKASSAPAGFIETSNRVDLKINQFAAYVTYGLTNRVEVSAAVPILDVRLGATTICNQVYNSQNGRAEAAGNCIITNGGNLQSRSESNDASGIGDIVLRGKVSLWRGEGFRLAAAVDVRVPSGDSLNFLGTGATGVRPFVAASLRGRVAPHGDFGFQWNGNSNIASAQGPGMTGKLPNNLFWVLGADARVVKRLTLSGDYLGQYNMSALREGLQTEPTSGFTGISTSSSSFNTNYATVGGKINPIGNLLITANVLFKLDNNGLHNKPAPLVGVSYTF
jgi:hypothetical protein